MMAKRIMILICALLMITMLGIASADERTGREDMFYYGDWLCYIPPESGDTGPISISYEGTSAKAYPPDMVNGRRVESITAKATASPLRGMRAFDLCTSSR